MKKGFTLIELIVVIAIIAILAGLVLIRIGNSAKEARDSRRKQDLDEIKKALNLYNIKNGNWIETGSGCGYNGNGQGWFNYTGGTSYLKSIAQCLVDEGFIPSEIIDPTGGRHSTSTDNRYTYMKYHCGTGNNRRVFVYAKLENVPQADTATDGTCCSICDTSYGMNYYIHAN